MFKDSNKNLRVTSIFFLVRFAASLVIAFLYILVAAAIQYLFVSLFGETTFNYIAGGLLSLILGAAGCILLGRVTFILIRCWHVCALSYAKKIAKRQLSALDVGFVVFKKNLLSFTVVYGIYIMVNKAIKESINSLWPLVEDVPILREVIRFKDTALARKIFSDVLGTLFDVVIYKVISSKEDIETSPQVILLAVKNYIFCVPKVMLESAKTYVCYYFIPKALAVILTVYCFLHFGFVAGVLQLVLLFPIFFLLRNTIFDTLELVDILSVYAKTEKEIEEAEEFGEEQGIIAGIVSDILEQLSDQIGISLDDLMSAKIDSEERKKSASTEETDNAREEEEEKEEEDVTPEETLQPRQRPPRPQARPTVTPTTEQTVEEEEDEEEGQTEPAPPMNSVLMQMFGQTPPTGPREVSTSDLQSLSALLQRNSDKVLSELPVNAEETGPEELEVDYTPDIEEESADVENLETISEEEDEDDEEDFTQVIQTLANRAAALGTMGLSDISSDEDEDEDDDGSGGLTGGNIDLM